MSFLYKPTCSYDKNFAFPSFLHIGLRANGFWPTDGDASNWLFRVLDRMYNLWNCVVICSVTLMVFSELMYIFVHFTNVAQAAESMSTVMIHAMIYVRMLHMRYAVKSLKTLLGRFVDKMWINQESHPLIFERCIRSMKPAFYMSIPILSGLALYIALPAALILLSGQTLESNNKNLPLIILVPYDYQKPLSYVITYICCGSITSVTIIQFCAMDALFSLFISFTCGQFDILHGRIMRLVPECHAEWLRRYGDEGVTDAANLKYLQRIYTNRLHELTKYHREIICFCIELEKFFSFPLMVNIVSSIFIIGFGGFQLLVSTDTARYLFMCNWEGGRISKNSPLLFEQDVIELDGLNVKLSSWRYISYHPVGNDFRRKLIMMIMRSYRPVQLTAMNFSIVSLQTFGQILSSSISYFALLKTFMDKQN